jgi:hypothetical protein
MGMLWDGMPESIQRKVTPFHMVEITIADRVDARIVRIRFNDEESVNKFNGRLIGYHVDLSVKKITIDNRDTLANASSQSITDLTKSMWYPFKEHVSLKYQAWVSDDPARNRYPVYVVSKGRSDVGLTTRSLSACDIYHYIVVEESEYQDYLSSANKHACVIILPENYLSEYDTCDYIGDAKSKGPGAARNFCIDHSSKLGFNRHWVMDDNIRRFFYANRNVQNVVKHPVLLRPMEDFIDRFTNVPVAGMNYEKFLKPTDYAPPFILNTRIYSCLLIDNTSGFRWRGRYNEDTDLSLRVLKDGQCTVQFNAFLCDKITTQKMRGGNTKEFYDDEGTLPKSEMLEWLHPDVAKVEWKFNRWHHHVNYKPFKQNRLIMVDDSITYEPNDYGLKLIHVPTGTVIEPPGLDDNFCIDDFN